jgi:hypothetical protein
MTQETPSKNTLEEIEPTKRSIIHIGGLRKKAKAHKYEEVENQRVRIRNELADIKEVLE